MRVRDDTTESNSPRESGFSFMSIDWNAIRLSLKNRSAALQSRLFFGAKNLNHEKLIIVRGWARARAIMPLVRIFF